MFFVVYIINNFDGTNDSDIDGAFAVIPFHWIQNVEIHIKNFLNKGINSAQVHKCFSTASARLDYMPNFILGPKCFPEDGTYAS